MSRAVGRSEKIRGGEESSNVVGIIAPPLIQIELTALPNLRGAITPLPPVSDGPELSKLDL